MQLARLSAQPVQHDNLMPACSGTSHGISIRSHCSRLTVFSPNSKVGAVDDPLEREADRVADQAIRQTDSAASTSPPSTNHAKESSADRSEIESRVVEHGLTGGGEPLSASLRAEMEPR